METLDLAEAAAFLRMSPEALRRKVKAGKIPGSKPGKQWVFVDADLVEYLRAQYSGSWQTPHVAGSTRGEPWHCGNVIKAPTGGSISERHRAKEYAALLEQPTGERRRNTTTK